MWDVFISYPRRDLETVRPIHDALRDLGLELFFDVEGGVDAGESFPKKIDAAVKGAKAVLGLWNEYALTREWVQIECDIAKARGVLVAAEFETITQDAVPGLFWHISRESLVGLSAGRSQGGWGRVLRALAAKLDAWAEANPADAAAAATLEKAAQLRVAALEAQRRAAEETPAASPVSPASPPGPESAAAGPAQPEADPAAERWERIKDSLDPRVYTHFIDVFPAAPQAFEAKTHRMQLEDWAAVDQTTPAAVDAFARGALFSGLADEVRRVADHLADLLAEETRRAEEEAQRAEEEARRAEEQARHAEEEARRAEEAEAEKRRRWEAMPVTLGAGAEGGYREPLKSGGRGPEMVMLPGGAFTMGDDAGKAAERPAHRVRVPPFALGRFPVTFEEYDAYCAATGASRADDGGWGRGRRPIIHVSWDDAQGYCQWLSEETGAAYRLPTEAEWEYACRAGTTTRYSFGDDNSALGAHAWYGRDSGLGTQPVGGKAPNGFGLADMHGNVWERVQDCWNDSYAGAPADGSAWMSGRCSRAVLRGGSWLEVSHWLRTACRCGAQRVDRFDNIGFRVARTVGE